MVDNYREDDYKYVGSQLLHVSLKCSQLMGNGEVALSALPRAVPFYDQV